MDSNKQNDQHEWLPAADYGSAEEAGRAATWLNERGIPSMIDQRMMSARFVLLVSALQQDEAQAALDDIPDEALDRGDATLPDQG